MGQPNLVIQDRLYRPLKDRSGDCHGYYSKRKNGILFLDRERQPFAFAVANNKQGFFFVSCSKDDEKIRYMFGLRDDDAEKLGIAGIWPTKETDLIKKAISLFNPDKAGNQEEVGNA